VHQAENKGADTPQYHDEDHFIVDYSGNKTLKPALARQKYVSWYIERNILANLGSRPFLGLIHRDQSRITTVSDWGPESLN
jgi:hypothetical protein